ncbi:MAG TPA: nicotinate-nucleotide adenylyltransferase [Longimicrobiales bacterium]
MNIGIFGGTFDPVHTGHLIVAQDAWSALGLDRVLFIPAAVPPHKRGRVAASPELRLEMLRAATAGDPRFATSDLELRRSGPSYTVDTLRELRERDPSGALFLLLGADQFREFHTWREPGEITRLATLVVLSRGGTEAPPPPLDLPYRRLTVTRVDISATEIRRRVAAGQPVRYLVPAAVEEIIRREGLYRAGARSAP